MTPNRPVSESAVSTIEDLLALVADGYTVEVVPLDLLGPDALLSHCIDLHDDEIAICADTETRVAHNPSAIASILGRCPAVELIEAGAVVAIGSDATCDCGFPLALLI